LVADHDLSTGGVTGSIVDAHEDSHGARIRAKFASTERRRTIRRLMVEKHLTGLGFSDLPVKFHFGQQNDQNVRFLTEVRIFETSVTP
jgi:hypothetical protein